MVVAAMTPSLPASSSWRRAAALLSAAAVLLVAAVLPTLPLRHAAAVAQAAADAESIDMSGFENFGSMADLDNDDKDDSLPKAEGSAADSTAASAELLLKTAELKKKIDALHPTADWKPHSVKISPTVFFEQFDGSELKNLGWVQSNALRDSNDPGSQYTGKWTLKVADSFVSTAPKDHGLMLLNKANHHAISKLFKPAPLDFTTKTPFVVQYEIKFIDGLTCSGAYMKLVSASTGTDAKPFDPSQLSNATPYTIMFGPDRCGSTKLHFIIRHKNPKTNAVVEHHCKNCSLPMDVALESKITHLFRLVVDVSTMTFAVSANGKDAGSGSLLSPDNFEPPLLPPLMIPDATAVKPDDWDDNELIPDPDTANFNEDVPTTIPDKSAKMPSDWLENEAPSIPKAGAVKPEDWDDESDGEWVPPMVDNPLCVSGKCGKWEQPTIANPVYKKRTMVKNPNFKGAWKRPEIENPDIFTAAELGPITPVAAVGFELWTMDSSIHFDNILVSNSLDLATVEKITSATWGETSKIETSAAELESKVNDLKAKARKSEMQKEALRKDSKKSAGKSLGDGDLLQTLLSVDFWKAQLTVDNLASFGKLLLENPSSALSVYPGLIGALVAFVSLLVLILLSSTLLSRKSTTATPTKKTIQKNKNDNEDEADDNADDDDDEDDDEDDDDDDSNGDGDEEDSNEEDDKKNTSTLQNLKKNEGGSRNTNTNTGKSSATQDQSATSTTTKSRSTKTGN